ncbi:MAG: DEAD/DEAH box helicase, partial [Verrucomicrobia bacterium]
MENFQDINIPKVLQEALVKMKYSVPTPIQAQAIPIALEGKDILGSAQTGTGKTVAFGLPALVHLLNYPQSAAIILTPTRELAMQVNDVMKQLLGKENSIHTALLIGGASMRTQLNALKNRPRLVVGTPGRINDHLERGTLRLKNTDFLVLDETDRMLDMGFGIQIDAILEHLPEERQTLMFSATLPKGIVRLAQKYLENPERIAVAPEVLTADNIKQDFRRLKENDKYSTLVGELQSREGSILVFVKTKRGADQLAFKLNKDDYYTKAIHGDLRQNQRDRVINDFRKEKCRILIATDVVARGLDIPHIRHVINYDMPQCPEDYIHRIGRTARAGAEGSALSLISPQDSNKMHAINRLLNPDQKESSSPRSQGEYNRNARDERPSRNRNRNRNRSGSGRSPFWAKKDSNDGYPAARRKKARTNSNRQVFQKTG